MLGKFVCFPTNYLKIISPLHLIYFKVFYNAFQNYTSNPIQFHFFSYFCTLTHPTLSQLFNFFILSNPFMHQVLLYLIYEFSQVMSLDKYYFQ